MAKSDGICHIKSEFLLKEVRVIASEAPAGEPVEAQGEKQEGKRPNSENAEETPEVPEKTQKIEEGVKKKKNRGQNKNRPVFREDRFMQLCSFLTNGPNGPKCIIDDCKYVHDINKYLETKPKDISTTCYNFSTKGFCARGLTCRYSSAHLDKNLNNIKTIRYSENDESTLNGITRDLQTKLRKWKYDFSDTMEMVKKYEQNQNRKEPENNANEITEAVSGVVDSEGIKGRDDDKVKPIDFRNKLMLSPLTTVGNLPFRRICKEFGADITCGEMACAVNLVKGSAQEWALTKRHYTEHIFGVQLCGNRAQTIIQAAQLLKENSIVDFVDLNIGCPINLIYQQGGGSALMRRPTVLETVTRSCSEILDSKMAFTVKMRTGVYADKSVAHDLFPKVEQWGASAITIHGRSREQRYTKHSNWDYIENCASKLQNIPAIGNGDILSFEDYNEKMKIAPHVSSVMIGRGALIKPWIFKEIKEQKSWDPTSSERFEIMQQFTNYGLEHWGSDTRGVENTRRFLLEWQSFLYRYIPYDLLVSPPQRINERPEKYHGRDEMETLMASSNCSDWIKLSEMLLGPVPEGFSFLPKHKANAY